MKSEFLNKHIVIFNRASLLNLSVSVVEHMFDRNASKEELGLLIGTAVTESDIKYRFQKGGGPARGIFQMEPGETGALDLFKNYLCYQNRPSRTELYRKLTQLWLGLDDIPFFIPSEEELGTHLAWNDFFAAFMARLQFWRVPKELPETVEGLAKYWKVYYNTSAGQGTVEQFLEKWRYYRCNELIYDKFGSEIPLRDSN